jgi:5-epi-alpha-selinene synthase
VLCTLALPNDFCCPISPAIHADAERAGAESLSWLQGFRLLPRALSDRFAALRIPEFVARAYPDAEYDDLRIVMDWTMWGFLADDHHDELARSASTREDRYREHIEVLRIGLGGRELATHAALSDLRARILARSSQRCLEHFTECAREWFESMHWEVRNRASSTQPTIREYLRMREVTVGMYTEYALFDVTHRLHTSREFWWDPDVRRLLAMSANLIGWANDVFSFRKERAERDPHNLVLLLAGEQALEDAVAERAVIAMHNQEMRAFLELEQHLRSQRDAPELHALIDCARAWIRGNLDWSSASSRYRASAESATPVDSSHG